MESPGSRSKENSNLEIGSASFGEPVSTPWLVQKAQEPSSAKFWRLGSDIAVGREDQGSVVPRS